ncbi:MAG: hypothetical protein AAF614_09235 [Chloroflexota bacterium]
MTETKSPPKQPYLTAWLGFVAVMSLALLILGLIFSSTTFGGVVYLWVCGVGGFYVFRDMVVRHVLTDEASLATLNGRSRHPFLKAWLGFGLLALFPTVFINFIMGFIPILALSFLISLTLFTTINFFVFRFVVEDRLVSQAVVYPIVEKDG